MTRKKSLIIALPVLILLAAWALYVYGYLTVGEQVTSVKEAEATKTASLEKYLAFVAKRADFEKRLTELKDERNADELLLLSGDTLSLAAASLETTVKGVITSRGGTISSERVEKPEDLGKFKVVSVSIDAVLPDAKALSDTLYAMETQTPYLVVRELDTRVKNMTQPADLMLRLKVSGLTGGK